MPIERFFVHDLTIRRWPTRLNRYNNTVRDLQGTPVDTTVRGWLGPSETVEVRTGGRNEERVQRPLRLPVDTDIRAGDQVLRGTATYEVDGIPDLAPTPYGFHHVHARLLAVTG